MSRLTWVELADRFVLLGSLRENFAVTFGAQYGVGSFRSFIPCPTMLLLTYAQV